MQNKKEKIAYVVLGILIALFVVYAWWFYQVSKTVYTDRARIDQVVNYLNEAIAKSQPAK